MKDTMKYCTYIYTDPKSNLTRYIGEGVISRAAKHLKGSHNSQLNNMIKKRIREGYTVEPVSILAKSKEDAEEMEQLLIALVGRKDLGLGPLFNLTDGGGCGGTANETPEAKTSRSASLSIAAFECQSRPEVKAKHRDRKIAEWADKEKRSAYVEAMHEAHKRPEVKATYVRNALEVGQRPEVKAARSSNAAKQWADQEIRATMSANIALGNSKPEARKKHSDSMKLHFAQPGVSEAHAERVKADWAKPGAREKRSAIMKAAALRNGVSAHFSSLRWYNNGVINKRLSEDPGEGWVRGRK